MKFLFKFLINLPKTWILYEHTKDKTFLLSWPEGLSLKRHDGVHVGAMHAVVWVRWDCLKDWWIMGSSLSNQSYLFFKDK
jgi:hypothetical protein